MVSGMDFVWGKITGGLEYIFIMDTIGLACRSDYKQL